MIAGRTGRGMRPVALLVSACHGPPPRCGTGRAAARGVATDTGKDEKGAQSVTGDMEMAAGAAR
jgi:hypothetical protein